MAAAQKFTYKLGKRLLKELPDEVPEGTLKDAFKDAINTLHRQDLKKELGKNFKKHFSEFKRIMKTNSKTVQKKSQVKGRLGEELVQSEIRGGNETGEPNVQLNKNMELKFTWLPKMQKLLKQSVTVNAVEGTLQALLEETETDIYKCTHKPNRAKNLAAEIRACLSACHLKLSSDAVEKSSEKLLHLMSALLSIYVDLCCIYCLKKVEKKKRYLNDVCSYVYYILHTSPEGLLEVILQSTSITKQTVKCLLPSLRRFILCQPAPQSHQHYLKHVLAIQKVVKHCDETKQLEMYLHARTLQPLDGFHEWLKKSCTEVLDLIKLKKSSYRKPTFALHIVQNANEAQIAMLQECLYADSSERGTDEASSDSLHMEVTETDLADIQITPCDSLFFIDTNKEGSKKASKKLKKQKTRKPKESAPKDWPTDAQKGSKNTAVVIDDIDDDNIEEISNEFDDQASEGEQRDGPKCETYEIESSGENSDIDSQKSGQAVVIDSDSDADSINSHHDDQDPDVSLKSDDVDVNKTANVSDCVFFSGSDIDTSADLQLKSVVHKIIKGSPLKRKSGSDSESQSKLSDTKKQELKKRKNTSDSDEALDKSLGNGDETRISYSSKKKLKSESQSDRAKVTPGKKNKLTPNDEEGEGEDIETSPNKKRNKKDSQSDKEVTQEKKNKLQLAPNDEEGDREDTDSSPSKKRNRKGSQSEKEIVSPGKGKEKQSTEAREPLSSKKTNKKGDKGKKEVVTPGKVIDEEFIEDFPVQDEEIVSHVTSGKKKQKSDSQKDRVTPRKGKRRQSTLDEEALYEEFIDKVTPEKNRKQLNVNEGSITDEEGPCQGKESGVNAETPRKKKANETPGKKNGKENETSGKRGGSEAKTTGKQIENNLELSQKHEEFFDDEDSESEILPITEKRTPISSKKRNKSKDNEETTPNRRKGSEGKEGNGSTRKGKETVTPNTDQKKGASKLNTTFDRDDSNSSIETKQSKITDYLSPSGSGKKKDRSSLGADDALTPKEGRKISSSEKDKPSSSKKQVDNNHEKNANSPSKIVTKRLGETAILNDNVVVLVSESELSDDEDEAEQMKHFNEIGEGDFDELMDNNHLKEDEICGFEQKTKEHVINLSDSDDSNGSTSVLDKSGSKTGTLQNKSIIIPSDGSESDNSEMPNIGKHLKQAMYTAVKLDSATASVLMQPGTSEPANNEEGITVEDNTDNEVESADNTDNTVIDLFSNDLKSPLILKARGEKVSSPQLRSPEQNKTIWSPTQNKTIMSPTQNNTKSITSPQNKSIKSPTQNNTKSITSPTQNNTKSITSPTQNKSLTSPTHNNTKSITSPTHNTKSISSPTQNNSKSITSPTQNKTRSITSPSQFKMNRSAEQNKTTPKTRSSPRKESRTPNYKESQSDEELDPEISFKTKFTKVNSPSKRSKRVSECKDANEEVEIVNKTGEQLNGSKLIEPDVEDKADDEDKDETRTPRKIQKTDKAMSRNSRQTVTENKDSSNKSIEGVNNNTCHDEKTPKKGKQQAKPEREYSIQEEPILDKAEATANASDQESMDDFVNTKKTRLSVRSRKSIGVKEPKEDGPKESEHDDKGTELHKKNLRRRSVKLKQTTLETEEEGSPDKEDDPTGSEMETSDAERTVPGNKGTPARRSLRARQKSQVVEESDMEESTTATKRTRSRSSKEETPLLSEKRETRRSTRTRSLYEFTSESESEPETKHTGRRSVAFKKQLEDIEEKSEKTSAKLTKKTEESTPDTSKLRARVLSASTSKKETKRDDSMSRRKRRLSSEFADPAVDDSEPTLKKATPKSQRRQTGTPARRR